MTGVTEAPHSAAGLPGGIRLVKPNRLLILACSQRKCRCEDRPYPIDYYNGPFWQTLRTVDAEGHFA
jgi:hypothetical protein